MDFLVSHNLDFNKAYERGKTIKVAEVEIRIASIEDLIDMKRHAGRRQDAADVEALLKIKSILDDE